MLAGARHKEGPLIAGEDHGGQPMDGSDLRQEFWLSASLAQKAKGGNPGLGKSRAFPEQMPQVTLRTTAMKAAWAVLLSSLMAIHIRPDGSSMNSSQEIPFASAHPLAIVERQSPVDRQGTLDRGTVGLEREQAGTAVGLYERGNNRLPWIKHEVNDS
eukprot:14743411-Alexandrium_andersonii.AAC.1